MGRRGVVDTNSRGMWSHRSPPQDIENHTHDWDDYLSQVKRSRKPYLELLSGDKAKVGVSC